MSIFLWDSAWESGDPDIDLQHRALLDQMERLAGALAGGDQGAETERTLKVLEDYVEAHFSAEEALMTWSGFPHLERHRALHDAMRARIARLVQALALEPLSVTAGVMEFLASWLLTHIAEEDRLLVEHLKMR